MTQPKHFFVGPVRNSNGERVECVGARVRTCDSGQDGDPSLLALDSLTALYGSNLPVPNGNGWVVRPLASDVAPEQAVQLLENVGTVKQVPEMTLEQVVSVVGLGAIKGL